MAALMLSRKSTGLQQRLYVMRVLVIKNEIMQVIKISGDWLLKKQFHFKNARKNRAFKNHYRLN